MSDSPKSGPLKQAIKKNAPKGKAAKTIVAKAVVTPVVAPTPAPAPAEAPALAAEIIVTVETKPAPKVVPKEALVPPVKKPAPAVEAALATSELELLSKKALVKFKNFGLATKVILLLVAIGVIAKLIHVI